MDDTMGKDVLHGQRNIGGCDGWHGTRRGDRRRGVGIGLFFR